LVAASSHAVSASSSLMKDAQLRRRR
jgi:hypothetical protein